MFSKLRAIPAVITSYSIHYTKLYDLLNQQYSVVDDFFTDEEVSGLRNSLLNKYEEEDFKKSAIGDQFNEQVIKSIRGDFISWIDESQLNETENGFFLKMDDFTNYLNRTCFLGIQDREFHYALYPIGTFYKRHLDIFQNDDSRKSYNFV